MNPAIENFVQGKRIAIIGASRSGKKFGNSVISELNAARLPNVHRTSRG